jgi:MOSC domain-containing protein YiiM
VGWSTGATRTGTVEAVSVDAAHGIGKANQPSIRLLAGLGVEGDAHVGSTIQHLSRVRRDPTQPNLRQVHLIHAELHDQLRDAGFTLAAGQMGENITTRGLDLLALPTGSRLLVGSEAVVEVTGLRNPCKQLDEIHPGLKKAVLGRDENGELLRLAGIMGVVRQGGRVAPGDGIQVELPPAPHQPLHPV